MDYFWTIEIKAEPKPRFALIDKEVANLCNDGRIQGSNCRQYCGCNKNKYRG